MECIRGKRSLFLDRSLFLGLVTSYQRVHLDLGAGDGRYVLRLARTQPDCFVMGVDACRENLRRSSHRAPSNALFVAANALCLPGELTGIVSQISIVFPWGSLLKGLLNADPALLDGMRAMSARNACLEVYLNAGALNEHGWELDPGAARIRSILRDAGLIVGPTRPLNATALREVPSTWAKRLACGRDPRAVTFTGRWADSTAAERGEYVASH